MIVRLAPSFSMGWLSGAVRPPELSATFFAKGTFRLTPNGPAQPVEEPDDAAGDTPFPEGPEQSLVYASDFAPFKPKADVLFVGSCHAPGGTATPACRVSLQLGDWSKVLAVIGDRSHLGGEPRAFTRMPLRYEHAFGGPDYRHNPIGKGLGTRSMPNIEDPSRLITAPEDRPLPAGFGPLHESWPQRRGRLGTYDSNWLSRRWPWLPEDFDWTHFNAAPRDQQLSHFLRGDERLVLENLHPDHSWYVTALPGVRAQVFVVVRENGSTKWREVPLNLDTVCVNGDEETVVLVWRGLTAIKGLKMSEVEEAHVASSSLREPPLSIEQYRARLEAEVEAARAAEASERAAEEEEEREMDAALARVHDEAAQMEAAADKQFAELRAQMSALGFSSDPEGTADDAQTAAGANAVIAAFAAEHPALAALLPQLQMPEASAVPSADAPWTRSRVESAASSKASLAETDLSGLDLSGLDLSGIDLREAFLAKAIMVGTLLREADLRGADLSGANLSDADLTGALLTLADLTGAVLVSATMIRARLVRACVSEADLTGASLDEAVADQADFSGSNLAGATLRKAHLEQSDFSGCRLEKADFSEAVLRAASLEAAIAPGVRMAHADLTGLHAGEAPDLSEGDFRFVRAEGSYWEGARLTAADFRNGLLARATFTAASAEKAIFDGADLAAARFDDATLVGASLVRVNLMRGSLERADVRAADLRGSNLYEAEVWDAQLAGARLDAANVKMTKLR